MSVPQPPPDPRAPAWGAPAGPGGPPKPPADPVADGARFRERLRLFLILLLALVVVTQLELPFRLAGLVLGLAAGWTAVRLLAQLGSGRAGAGQGARSWVLVIGGLGLAGVLTLLLLAEAVYYPLVSDLEKCLAGANTQTAQQACQDASKDRLDRLVDRLKNHAATP